jgi:predicted TIM-barrel fold metal-dependent hydrolase
MNETQPSRPTLSRRTFLKSTVATAAMARWAPSALAKAAQPRTAVDFDVPAGACDCHVHIFGDPQRFPFFPGRTYTPEEASVDELRALHRAIRFDRVVVVHPSVYGIDNACTLDALRQLGDGARGVAVIDEATPDSALDEMGRAGIRGIRLNLTQAGVTDPAAARRRFQAAVRRVMARNWHIQIYSPIGLVDSIADLVLVSPVPVVFDHFGGAVASDGLGQPGFGALVNLVRSGKAYVKISGAADLVSTRAPDYPDVAPFARALVSANPGRILWGTNWPHPDTRNYPGRVMRKATEITPLVQTDDGLVLNLLPGWVPDADTRKAILVDNPAKLYGFT